MHSFIARVMQQWTQTTLQLNYVCLFLVHGGSYHNVLYFRTILFRFQDRNPNMVLLSSVYQIKCGFALNEKVYLQLWIPVYCALMTRAAEWCRWTIMTSCYQRGWTDVARQAGIAQVSVEVNKILMIYLASFSLLPELSFLLDMRSGKPGPLLVTTLEKTSLSLYTLFWAH